MERLNPSSRLRKLPALLAGAAAIALCRPAEAAPCSMLSSPVYLTGSGKVVIASLAKALAASGITLVYNNKGSCLAVDAIVNGTPLGLSMVPEENGATYWDATGMELSCDWDAAGNIANIGLSDVFAATCSQFPNQLPETIGDTYGPIEAYTFVVPKGSTQQTFSKEAGYFVFGFGADSGVAPWTDPAFIFQRDPGSGTQQMLGVALGVPADKWKGTPQKSSTVLAQALTGSLNPEASIGILTTEVAGANRASLNMLSYQDAGQPCGYWPDSTSTANDKKNVRDGHYPIWGPLHLFYKQTAQGYPVDPKTADVVAYMTGTKPPPGNVDLIYLLAGSGIIPRCAMRVTRDSELGPLASYSPQGDCGCYFDKVTNASSIKDCKACMTDVECPAATPRCNYGYCEPQ